jgi:hypothetical protein
MSPDACQRLPDARQRVLRHVRKIHDVHQRVPGRVSTRSLIFRKLMSCVHCVVGLESLQRCGFEIDVGVWVWLFVCSHTIGCDAHAQMGPRGLQGELIDAPPHATCRDRTFRTGGGGLRIKWVEPVAGDYISVRRCRVRGRKRAALCTCRACVCSRGDVGSMTCGRGAHTLSFDVQPTRRVL